MLSDKKKAKQKINFKLYSKNTLHNFHSPCIIKVTKFQTNMARNDNRSHLNAEKNIRSGYG